MNPLIETAGEVMAAHGWSTELRPRIASAHLDFDLIAESDAAIAFFSVVPGPAVRERAQALAAEIAAVTLGRDAGIKAWEAYLILVVAEDFEAAEPLVDVVQRDLNYCRKVVLDGSGLAATASLYSTLSDVLAFLFPLDVGPEQSVEDVRQHLVQSIRDQGYPEPLVQTLVDAFDSESDSQCWDRVKQHVETHGAV